MTDAPKDDNVMDLLDSLDSKHSQKSKPKKASTRKKEAHQKEAAQKKAAGDDILGFLDELKLENSGDATKPAPGSEPKQDASASAAQLSGDNTTKETTKETSKEARKEAQKETNKEANEETNRAEKETEPEKSLEPDAQGAQGSEDRPQEGTIIDPVASISSWWSRNKGGLWGAATDAATRAQDALQDAVQQARQAEARVREEQPHFSLNSLQSRLTSVLNTIVPPISRHEQLKIHIFHDMVGYPSIDQLLYEVFDYVMDQVEGGGDLNLVVQKGKERHRAGSDYDVQRSLNYARCSLEDGVKLAKANVEEVRRVAAPAPTESGEQSGEPQQEQQQEKQQEQQGTASKPEDKDSNINVSEVFISIQPVLTPGEHSNLIAPSTESLYFAVYLSDFIHQIELSTASQAFPAEWAQWLESDGEGFKEAAIDPREWVSVWLEDGLNLAFGILAQKYVTTRMGLTK